MASTLSEHGKRERIGPCPANLKSVMPTALRFRRSAPFRNLKLITGLLGLLAVVRLVPGVPAGGQNTPQDLFKEAQAAKARGDLLGAERKYLELIQRSPEMGNAYHNLGIVYLAEHKYCEAVQVLEKAVKLEPHEPGGWFVQGLAYYELYEPREAVAAFRTALRLSPADKNVQLYLGKAQIQMRDYEGAAETLEKLAKSSPHDPTVLYNLGVAHMKLMLDDVDRLGAAAPQSYLLFLLLAQDAQTRGDDDAAARFYREALRVNPGATGAHYALGSIYANSGKYDGAAEEFREELKLNANDSLALWKLGEISLRTDPRSACDYLERALTLNPDLPQARLAYGRALFRLGQTEKAVREFEQVERLAPEEDSVHYHLANAYRKLGRLNEADAEMTRFQELANRRSEITHDAARRQIEMSRDSQEGPQPNFDPSRNPVHH